MRSAHPAPSPAPSRSETQRKVGRSPERRSPVFELENALDEYLSHLRIERGASPRTAEAYRRDLEDYLAFLDGEGVEGFGDIDREKVARLPNAASWSRTSPSPPCAGASPPCAATTGSLCARGSPMRTRPTPWTFPRPPTGCRTCFPSRKWARCWTPSWASARATCATGRFWKCSTVAGCAPARPWGSIWRPSTSTTASCACSARDPMSASCPLPARPSARCAGI